MSESLAQQVARLPPAERERVLRGIPPDQLAHDWSFWGRPEQILPADDSWDIALALAGRGWGKTRAAAEWVRQYASAHPGSHGIIVARTAADARDVLVEGPSGIIAVHPPGEAPHYEPSKRRLTWPNGSTASTYSADEPDQLRGPQSDFTVCDEIATWSYIPDSSGLTAWDNARIATRLGANPQLLALTTPKRTPLIRQLLDDASRDPRFLLRTGSTSDNAGNLSRAYLDTIYGLYQGTSLARQELEGVLLDDVEGALWSSDLIDAHRAHPPAPADLRHPLAVIIAVDPSVADQPTDECGIIVIATTTEPDLYRRHVYVLEDRSLLASPNIWAQAVAQAARDHGAPGRPAPIVAEVNQGGALVTQALTNIDPTLRVHPVRARYGKLTRAEPIAMATEQGRVHLPPYPASLPALTDQMISWNPATDRRSPDRIDALVWGATAAIISPPPGLPLSPPRARAYTGPLYGAPSSPSASPSPRARRRPRALSVRVPGPGAPAPASPGALRNAERFPGLPLPPPAAPPLPYPPPPPGGAR